MANESMMVRCLRGRIEIEPCREERYVREAAHKFGLRYRLHDEEIPGRPHLVFPATKSVLFVCSCWTYGHHIGTSFECELDTTSHDSRIERDKLDRILWVLRHRNWNAFVLWGCEVVSYARSPGEATPVKVKETLADRINDLVRKAEASPSETPAPPGHVTIDRKR